jgi:nitroreductase
MKAPTNDHMRSWEFVIVNDIEARLRLLEPLFNPTPDTEVEKWMDSRGMRDALQREMYKCAVPKQYAMLCSSGCLILPFFHQTSNLLQPQSLSSLNGFASIWCCIENMLLAAATEGIFGVTRIPMDKESRHIKTVVNHPDGYIMPCYLALGYPAQDAVVVKQNQVSAKERIHLNVW